jgi:flagellar basal-body rod protein FlgF/flagellar basal-body rod protein FlgG
MENALLVGLSRQSALRRELDVIANNIANLNTTGFKADGAVFQEHIPPAARGDGFRATDRRISFVTDRATWHDHRAGPVQQTGNPLDVAIDGSAFIVVQTPGGERYTRNGAFQLNAGGELVTSEGHRVLGDSGPIVFQPQDRNITFGLDGSVSAGETVRGKLRLVEFAQPGQLQKDSSSSFQAPAGVQPQPSPYGRVLQGSVEKSNVNGVMEMTRMIEATRTYTNISQLMQSQGDMRKTAIDRLAEVPA